MPQRSRLLTWVGWIVLVLGLSSPVRMFIQDNSPGPMGLIWILLALLTGLAGWGLIKRFSWAPAAGCIAFGANVGVSATAMVVIAHLMIFFRTGLLDERFVRENLEFFLVNLTYVFADPVLFVIMIRPATRQECGTRRGPLLLSSLALGSAVVWSLITRWGVFG